MLVMSETEMVGTLAYHPEDFDAVIAAMAKGGVYTDKGWVEQIPVDDVVSAFETLRAGKGMKFLVTA
jgi:(R,R)-butanediol dehydrogenase/meso-butanediol dehydrogenase/diacetyl reductase